MIRLLGLTLLAVSLSPVHMAPSDFCATVKCAAINCTHSVKPAGQCCEICPGTDCSAVPCIDLDCTKYYTPKGQCCPVCRKDKQGKCPKIENDIVGICVEACSADEDCNGNEKCCSNGCGHTCQTPVNCKAVKCETLACTNNYIPEGECCPVCREDKPGKCPATVIETCFGERNCSLDQDCQGHEKCCSNNCGNTCQDPECTYGQNGICGGILGLTCTTGTTCMFMPKGVADGTGKCCYDNSNAQDSA